MHKYFHELPEDVRTAITNLELAAEEAEEATKAHELAGSKLAGCRQKLAQEIFKALQDKEPKNG